MNKILAIIGVLAIIGAAGFTAYMVADTFVTPAGTSLTDMDDEYWDSLLEDLEDSLSDDFDLNELEDLVNELGE